MALVYNNPQATGQTHVMIIGIGGYPYLVGGDTPKQGHKPGIDALGQLTSAPVSAAAFYQIVRDLEHTNSWTKPLGSVDVLISKAPDQNEVLPGVNYNEPTLQNIKTAYNEWKARCDSNEDNVAIFYYCGHGLEKAEHFLLAQDFGDDPQDPWDKFIALDTTCKAFYRGCKAKVQCFFIDACRQLTASMLTTDFVGTRLQNPSITATECTYNLKVKAAAINEPAYGRKNATSYFTEALINGLKGDAATQRDGQWQILTSSISSKINELLQDVKASEGYKQRCVTEIGDSTQIIKLNTPPNVRIEVCIDPDAALAHADISAVNAKTNQKFVGQQQGVDPWVAKVPAGIYQLKAQFPPASNYLNTEDLINVVPPVHTQKFSCQ